MKPYTIEVNPKTPFMCTSEKAEAHQSNGALMRCMPLACINDDTAIMQDVWMTNPSTIAYWCEFIYLGCCRLALMNTPPMEIWNFAVKTGKTAPEIIHGCTK